MKIWRLTVGDKVIQGGSFTPLRGIVDKLIAEHRPFKVGFGEESEFVLPADRGAGDVAIPPEEQDESNE